MQGNLPRTNPKHASFSWRFKLPVVKYAPLEPRSESPRNALKPGGVRVSRM
jgi:hypothetical protein